MGRAVRGNIFLGRQRRRRVEVLNDANSDVVNLFRVVQRHGEALAAELRFSVASRTEYARLLRLDSADLTDIERAAGKEPYVAGSKTSAKVLDVGELTRRIEELRQRLDRVTIEALDFETILRRYDDRAPSSISTRHTGGAPTSIATAPSARTTSAGWPRAFES